MPRLPRLQIAGGVVHVTGRGNRRQAIFLDSADRATFLWLLDELGRVRGWIGHAYCLMPNHYHLVLETPEADLSAGMQRLNGRYARAFNQRHAVDGHLFQGRFYSGQVEGNWHLLELFRYLARNPVDAGLCRHPREWPWGSYRAVAGMERSAVPRFLDVKRALGLFGSSPASARNRFRSFVDDGPSFPQT